jgi:hypothetical protein
MQVAALGRPIVGISSASEANTCGSRGGAIMYLQSREGLGQDFKETSSGDIVGDWLAEQLPRLIGRVIGLKIRFRRSLTDFRLEVAGAVAR